jgi:hypothetical protein
VVYIYIRGVTDNSCTKQGNSSIFEPKIRGFKSGEGYNGMRKVEKRCINNLMLSVTIFCCGSGRQFHFEIHFNIKRLTCGMVCQFDFFPHSVADVIVIRRFFELFDKLFERTFETGVFALCR